MQAYPALFRPGTIGRMTVKNHLFMAPMVRNYADATGRVTDKYLAHIERIAQGGVGGMLLEASFISPNGRGFANELGIHEDAMIPGLRQLVDLAHAHGVVIGPQLLHAGRQTSSTITGLPIVAPSALPDPTINEIPQALSGAEIAGLIEDFAQAARRAVEAGCDFVEIHGAHGYLITQFLSGYSNVRDDDYGGSADKRFRFLAEVVEAVRATVGADYPVLVRLSGEEQVPSGLTIEDTLQIARKLEAMGVNALDISAGSYASYERGYMISPMAIPDAPLVPLAQAVKSVVQVPVIVVDKIRFPDLAEVVLTSGDADFISLGRTLLADPEWPNKAREGRVAEINQCIACNQGCISRLFEQQDVWCTVNPECARELDFAPMPTETGTILVVGGGPAGMSAARTATLRGHAVVLCETLDHLGGQLIAASAAPYRPGWRELLDFQIREMERLQVDVRLNTQVTPELARALRPDVAMLAMGSSPVRMSIPGSPRAHVVTARDLLEGKVTANGRVVIAGGGCAGAQTAEYLATRGHAVTVVEMMRAIAVDAPRAERELLLGRLQRLGVQMQREAKILRVEEDAVVVERPIGTETIPADTVVLCLGALSNDGLLNAMKGIVPYVLVVGDALQPRKVTEAIAEGALAVLAAEAYGQQQLAA